MQKKKKRSARTPRYAAKIARDVLNLKTLRTRKSDRLDFHELSVWDIRKALEAAYIAGRDSVATK